MRKSVSTAFFSLVSTLMVLGIVLMGASEWVLFKNYFAKDRYETLDQVVGVTQRTAQYLAQQAALPEGDELDALSTKLEIIGESAEAYLFFTDNDGNVMIASSPDKLEADGRAGRDDGEDRRFRPGLLPCVRHAGRRADREKLHHGQRDVQRTRSAQRLCVPVLLRQPADPVQAAVLVQLPAFRLRDAAVRQPADQAFDAQV